MLDGLLGQLNEALKNMAHGVPGGEGVFVAANYLDGQGLALGMREMA